MHAAWWMLGALAVLAIAYRYYSAFLAAKVLCLDDRRVTPAHRLEDGQNFHPTNRVVLFGHHFAAITGAGPLIGPVLAAQFGFYPGFLWILFGVVLAGGVHDFVILVASTRRDGRSLAEIARDELGPTLGVVTAVAVLFIVIIALAGLGNVVVSALAESAWGVFTVSASIPIAFVMGLYTHHVRRGSIRGIHGGGPIVKGPLFPFIFITIACGAISGFHALVSSGTTPKMVDRERDCRSIGYGAMLMEGLVGITALIAACAMPQEDYVAINTNPQVAIVATESTHGEGLARDAAQLASIDAILTAHDRELLGVESSDHVSSRGGYKVALGHALALSNGTLAALGYHVDLTAPRATMLDDSDFARLGVHVKELPSMQSQANEVVAARTGGGVSLAVGMARVFSGLPGMSTLLAYWYHFAIMFEALFILTTIDTGTRIGRFLVQEFIGRVSPQLGKPSSKAGAFIATTIIVAGWSYFILTGNISTLWPMFGIANQLLACTALCVATTILLREATNKRYALVTALPLVFVTGTTVAAGAESIRLIFLPLVKNPTTRTLGIVNVTVTSLLLACIAMVVAGSLRRWLRTLTETESNET